MGEKRISEALGKNTSSMELLVFELELIVKIFCDSCPFICSLSIWRRLLSTCDTEVYYFADDY